MTNETEIRRDFHDECKRDNPDAAKSLAETSASSSVNSTAEILSKLAREKDTKIKMKKKQIEHVQKVIEALTTFNLENPSFQAETFFETHPEFAADWKATPPAMTTLSAVKFTKNLKKMAESQKVELGQLQSAHDELKNAGKKVVKQKSAIIKKSKKDSFGKMPQDSTSGSNDSDTEDEDKLFPVKRKVPSVLKEIAQNTMVRIHAQSFHDMICNWRRNATEIKELDAWRDRMEDYMRDEGKIGTTIIIAFSAKKVSDDDTLIKEYISALLLYMKVTYLITIITENKNIFLSRPFRIGCTRSNAK